MKRHLLDSSPSDRSQGPTRSVKAPKQVRVRMAKNQLLTKSKRIRTLADEMTSLIEAIQDTTEDQNLSHASVVTKRRKSEK